MSALANSWVILAKKPTADSEEWTRKVIKRQIAL